MIRILSKLNRFCSENKIEYTLTGTAALEIMGLPSTFKPGDIDIKLIAPTQRQIDLLVQQQRLSGLDNKEYDTLGGCISFYICGCKVNALLASDYARDEALANSQAIELIDKETPYRFIVHVQKVNYALADKMVLDVIKCITSFIH